MCVGREGRTCVRVEGLTVRTELNGRSGVVVSIDRDAGRCGVTLDDQEPHISVSVRAERLVSYD